MRIGWDLRLCRVEFEIGLFDLLESVFSCELCGGLNLGHW